LKRWRGASMRELAVFSRQFATLVASGMPMLRALHTLEEQTEDEVLKEAVAGVREDAEAGGSLEQGMERHPKVFDRLFRAMVHAGEQSGRLDDTLDRVAFQIEKMDALRRQIRSALFYPAFVFLLALTVMIVAVAVIVPIFVKVFYDIAEQTPGTSTDLPIPTQITIAVSNALTHQWFLIVPGVILLIIGFIKWKKSDRGREQWDRLKLRIPFRIGDVIQKVALARWSRTFSGSISAGVPMLQAIELTGDTAGNVIVQQAMKDVHESVKRGGSISAPIANHAIFPPMVGHMVAVGEETGQLEHMLTKIADFYETEVDAKVKALTSLIEPLMICFVGGVVGFVVISMYLPIFSLYDKIR
jgi:type IV pilus assembly protein PilC